MEFDSRFTRSTRAASEFALEPPAVESFAPRDAAEVARLLAECDRAGQAVVPWGGGTMQGLGGLTSRAAVVIETARLDQVVEHQPDDLTVTVQAGLTLGRLQEILGAHNQFLPLDAASPAAATIGGVLAAGASGPLRLRYGPPRDFTLGLRFATVEGHVVKAGGKVVKNVAGYELTKLLIGSLGTLGIITEATFKTYPRLQADLTLLASFSDWHAACAAFPSLWKLPTPPLALELCDPQVARSLAPDAGGWLLAARLGGANAALQTARDRAAKIARENSAVSVEFQDNAHDLWRTIADLPATAAPEPEAVVVRIGAAPHDLARALETALRAAEVNGLASPKIFGHAATAILYAAWSGDSARTIALVKQLRSDLAGMGAHVVVEAAPAPVKRQLDVWGEVGPGRKLMRAIKAKFDPHGILNPGRFVDGI